MGTYISGLKKFGNYRFVVIFVLVILVSFVGVSCGKKKSEETANISYSEDTAKIISHVTSGIISSGDKIYLRFVDPVVGKDSIGEKIEDAIFKFKPEIKGISKWEDRRTVAFYPDTNLPFHTKYTGVAEYKSLDPDFRKMAPVKFGFKIAGRELENLSGDFELADENAPDRLYYSGTVKFSETIEFDKVKKNIVFLSSSGEIPLLWSEKSSGREFVFTSKTVMRKKGREDFILKISKKGCGISEEIVKKIKLEPLKKFVVKEIIKFDKGQMPGLEIRFSQKLKRGQNLDGLISVEPEMPVSVKSINKSIFVSGNFKFGERYTLKISGIKSKWGIKIPEEIKKTVDFEDKKPQISFSSSGIFLPSSENRKIGFRTINVRKVQVVVKKVFESNLGQFLQSESISSEKTRNDEFAYYDINRVGIKVAEKTLKIGSIKNRWLNHQLDLKNLIDRKDKGIFLIEIKFLRKDMLYSKLKKKASYYYGKDYYSNPNSYGYMYRHGSVYKPVIVSDIGLTYKRGGGEHFVFANNLVDSSPLGGVKVTLRTFQNQIIASGKTDGDGKKFFKNIKEEVFYVEAEKDGQRSIIKPTDMAWNLSSFDTGGVVRSSGGTRAFIYTERGVYRPGDQINLSVIARNDDGSFPDNHPVTLELLNPRNQVVKKIVKNTAIDGFYNFPITTSENDITGNWRAELTVGSTKFFHTLKIETVVPFRLKVKLKAEKKVLTPSDKSLGIFLDSKYLFGSPSPYLNTEIKVSLKAVRKVFKKFREFSFSNEIRNFKYYEESLFDGKLNGEGKVYVSWKLPDLSNVPSSLLGEIKAKVFEKGGRATTGNTFVNVDPYVNYVGLERPKLEYGYSRVGTPVNINTILVSRKGEPISGRQLRYKIFKNSRYWWWEYDNLKDFRVRYKNDHYTKVVKSGTFKSKNIPVPIEFVPEESGEYFIEVEEVLRDGHKAGFFFSSYYWGESPSNSKDAGSLALKSNKKKYYPGDTAVISFPIPEKGTILVTLEKGDRILNSWVKEVDNDGSEFELKIPVTEKMLPNAYASVSIIQPHSQTANDRPIRVYGTIPIMVVDPSTKKDIEIIMPDELKSNKNFEVKVRAKDGKTGQFTIAIVDEGLLDLTRFVTPDPWKNFFSKEKSGISTFDLFAHVLSANKGDVFRLFSIGGDMEVTGSENYRSSQLESGKSKRFTPVALFRGPLSLGKNGEKKIKFKMPDYIGSVRVMVIVAKGKSYGKAEKTVPVKTDLIVLPTLPRVLGPGDEIKVPVSVFALNDKIKTVKLTVKTSSNLKVIGKNLIKLKFEQPGEKDTFFDIKVANTVGESKVILEAVSGKFKISKATEIEIRPSSPRLYGSVKSDTVPGKIIEFTIPKRGLNGTNRASVVISKKSKLDLENRLSWLIHYPYGCIEQTVSSVFPQLYLKEFVKDSSVDMGDVDNNINIAIERLRRFLLPSGGLSYWPGNRDASIWGTNYAFHFLTEAKKRGYSVPKDLYNAVIRFQRSRSLVTTDRLLERVYRLYVMALAGVPQTGPMNLLLENDILKMTNVEKWMLSATYFLSGKKGQSNKIRNGIAMSVMKYKDPGRTYGSRLRDRAIILEALTLFEDWNKADLMYEEMVAELSDNGWYSTQSLGFSLMALGKYMIENEADFRENDSPVSGYIVFPGNKKKMFNFKGLDFKMPIESGFGEQLKVFVDKKVKLGRVFVTLQWSGVPLKSYERDIADNLNLQVVWFDEEGRVTDPSLLKQGTTFWGRFRVGPGIYSGKKLSELALVQIMPAGWEIENTRLSGDNRPEWMDEWALDNEEYTDIRDDRIMWFFDMGRNTRYFDFIVKINCVTAGRFMLPPTVFEAMYNNNYRAVKKGGDVEVVSR